MGGTGEKGWIKVYSHRSDQGGFLWEFWGPSRIWTSKNVFNSCRKFLGERKYKLIWRGSLELELLERTLGEKTEGRYWEDLELSPFFLSLFGWLHLVIWWGATKEGFMDEARQDIVEKKGGTQISTKEQREPNHGEQRLPRCGSCMGVQGAWRRPIC